MSVSSSKHDLYALLSIQPDVSEAAIRTAYRQAARVAHPDKGGSKEKFHLVAVAFEVLSCPIARALYDRQRQHSSTRPASWGVPQKRGGAATEKSSQAPRAKRRRCADASRDNQASCAMERLRKVLQGLDPQDRRAVIGSLTPCTRSALSDFMQKVRTTPARANFAPRRLGRRGCSAKATSGTVRTKHYAHCTRYFAQVQFGALSLYTSAQTELETAIDHRIMLARLCQAMAAVRSVHPKFWEDHVVSSRTCEAIFKEYQTSADDLGLRVWVRMTATEWLPKSCVISSSVMPLPCALELHGKLRRAKLASWNAFRAGWIDLQVRRGIRQEQAEASVDEAKRRGFQLYLVKAVRDAERYAAMHHNSTKAKSAAGAEKGRGTGKLRTKPSSLMSRMMGA